MAAPLSASSSANSRQSQALPSGGTQSKASPAGAGLTQAPWRGGQSTYMAPAQSRMGAREPAARIARKDSLDRDIFATPGKSPPGAQPRLLLSALSSGSGAPG
jgi:hypothetical protein